MIATNTVCYYHANCADGSASSWVVEQALPGTKHLAIRYGREPVYERLKGKDVYVVDFSFPVEVLMELEKVVNKLVLLDHHVSAERALKDFVPSRPNTEIVFDMERSGARIAWDYFFQGKKPPYHILAVEDYDMYKFSLEHTAEIAEVVYLLGIGPVEYDNLFLNHPREEIVKLGSVLLKKKFEDVERAVSRAVVECIEYEGSEYYVPVTNCHSDISSATGHKLCEVFDSRFSLSYHDNKDLRIFSVRGRGQFDCSKFAEFHGGGGHFNASGFTKPKPPIL